MEAVLGTLVIVKFRSIMERAQRHADEEGVSYVVVTAGTRLVGKNSSAVCKVDYCVRAIEARLYEITAGTIVSPRGGERYRSTGDLTDRTVMVGTVHEPVYYNLR